MGRPRKIVRRSSDVFIHGSSSAEFALERLPDELLLATMSRLAAADLAAFACVCRRFAVLSRDETLWSVLVARLTCRAPSQVSKPPSRSWCKHYQHLSTPPTFAAVCCDLPVGYCSYVMLDDCIYVAMPYEIVQYRAPAKPGPVDEADIVRRLSSTDGRKWKSLELRGLFLIAWKFVPTSDVWVAVLLDRNLTMLSSIRLPDPDDVGPYFLLLVDRCVLAVLDESGVVSEGSAGVAGREIGSVPFCLDAGDDFEFVATERSFGAIVDTKYGFGRTSWRDRSRRQHTPLKFVEISTVRSDSGGHLAVLDEVMLPEKCMVELASIDDTYLILSGGSAHDAQLEVFAVRTRRTTLVTLPSWVDDHPYILHFTPAPATGLLYVSLWPCVGPRPTLLFALNSSGACLWRMELDLAGPAFDAVRTAMLSGSRVTPSSGLGLSDDGVYALGFSLLVAVCSVRGAERRVALLSMA